MTTPNRNVEDSLSRGARSEEEAGLLRELEGAGFSLQSIWQWVNSGPTPVEAVPILLRRLATAQDERLVEGLVRSLTDSAFRQAAPVLVERFQKTQSEQTLWAIGNALAVVGFPKTHWHELLQIAGEQKYGTGRQMIVGRLHKIKLPEVEPLLVALLDDPAVDAFAASALRYCGGTMALDRLRSLSLEGRSSLMKREVMKTVAKLERPAKSDKAPNPAGQADG
jgi:hypothetical protein